MRKQNSTAKYKKNNYSVLDGDTCCGKRKTETKMVSKFRENSGVGMEEGSG